MSDTFNDATTSDFDNSAQWTTEDFQGALRTISELRRERNEARAALSGRTVSCSQCNESAKKVTELESKVATLEAQKDQWRMSSVCREKDAQIQTMREAIKEAHDAFKDLIELQPDIPPWANTEATLALAKLKPFITP